MSYPRFGAIVVDGVTFDHDVVIEGETVRAREKGPSRSLRGAYGHTPLSAGEVIPWSAPRLVVGTGASGRLPVMADVQRAATEHGVALVTMPTAEACELLRSLGPGDANAILHVTC